VKRITWLSGLAASAVAVSAITLGLTTTAQASAHPAPARAAAAHLTDSTAVKPTIVLVHGAWADASIWTPVIGRLQAAGYTVDAPPNPLRGLNYDSDYIASYLKQISGPVILVGHSYGGAVITDAATGDPNVKALVYIAAFAPAQGESLRSLLSSSLDATIPALPTVASTYPDPDGTSTDTELTINTADYPSVLLDNELPADEEDALAAEQRPLSLNAVTETSGTPAWETIPSWYMVATGNHAIAPVLEEYMAARAGSHTVEVAGPHLIMLTNPGAVTSLIERAAVSTTGA
jgi:pimeloyl-ACP methyl ester carboxylesterase